MSFIARYVYTYEEFIFVTEASAVQQNKNTDNKIIKIEQVIPWITIYKLAIVCAGILK